MNSWPDTSTCAVGTRGLPSVPLLWRVGTVTPGRRVVAPLRQPPQSPTLQDGNYGSGEQAERAVGIAAGYAVRFQPVRLLPGFKHGLGVSTEFSIHLNFKGLLKFAYPESTGALPDSFVIN